MAHHRHGNGPTAVGFEPFTHALGIITGTIDHFFAADVTLVRMDNPFISHLRDPSCRAKPLNAGAHLSRPFGQCLSELGGINITVIGIP